MFQKLRVPIIVAPMAGISNPKFVISSSRSGALGSFGFAYIPPEKIASDIRQVHKENLLVNANFFIFPSKDHLLIDQTKLEKSLQILKQQIPETTYSRTVSPPKPPYFPDLESQLEAIWETRPECLSFHFGLPPENVIEKAKSLGITLGMSATSVEDALQVAKSGADYVVLQGVEAGGHRGTFLPNDSNDEKLSAIELFSSARPVLNQNYPNLKIVVAGGIMTRAAVTEVLSLGATAVQLGTIFIPTKESSASLQYKNALLGRSRPTDNDRDPYYPSTIYTTLWSGRMAQCLPNSFTNQLKLQQSLGYSPLPFPLQNTVTQSIREVAKGLEDPEYQSLYAGSNYHLCHEVLYPEEEKEGEKEKKEGEGKVRWRHLNELPSVEDIVEKLNPFKM